MKCILCDQRKARRFCPAKNALICPQCCGEKRVVEIHCPESCEYLQAGRKREVEQYAKYVRGMDQSDQVRNQRLITEHQDVLARLELALGRERLASRDLSDKDVAEAVGTLLQTYKTEEKGILYETTSEDLRIESVRRELRDEIERLRNPEREERTGIVDPQSERLKLGVAIECLEFIQSMVRAYMNDRRGDYSYIDFLARLFPREEKPSSLLLP